MARGANRLTPTVTSKVLYTDDPATTGAAVGSTTWFTWLETATAFYYDDPRQPFTARAERKQRGGVYWTAYRRTASKLHKCYLGKPGGLTAAHLADVAQRLAEG